MRVLQYDKKGNLVASYESVSEASRKTGINRGNISSSLNGHKYRHFVGGYEWDYGIKMEE